MHFNITNRPHECTATLSENSALYHLVYTFTAEETILEVKSYDSKELKYLQSVIGKIKSINCSKHSDGLLMYFYDSKNIQLITKELEKEELLPKPFASFIYSYLHEPKKDHSRVETEAASDSSV